MNRNHAWFGLIGLIAVGCGGDSGGDADAGDDGEDAVAAAPAVDPAIAATIGGTIMFEGTPPAGEAIDMSEEPECADDYDGQPMTQAVVTGDGGGLANVFVYVKEGLGDMTFPTASDAVTLDQDGCRYHPHVLGLMSGQELLIRNSDPVLHNINTQAEANRSFNISQPQEGMESRRSFNAAEVMIPVKCDVHGWMSAYIGVTSHPYHAVTDADGSFSIEGLPPGDYVIEAWHEALGAQTMNVTVAASETGTADFTYSENAAYAPVPMGEPVIVHHGHADDASHPAG